MTEKQKAAVKELDFILGALASISAHVDSAAKRLYAVMGDLKEDDE